MKIFVISPSIDKLFTEAQLEVLKSAGDLTLVQETKPLQEIESLFEGDEPRIVAVDPDFTDWKFPNDVIDAIPNLQAICLQTTSFSWLDIDHCTQKGIQVLNLRGFSSVAVAEWGTMMTLALARKVPIAMKDGWKVDYVKHKGIELRGKTAGVIGLGQIGTAFAENMTGLGMKVQYYSRSSQDERFSSVTLPEVMATSDVIFFSVANNDETKKILTDELIQSMKSSAIFVNIVDPIYNHELMLEMVKTGKLYGYGFENEKNSFSGYEGNVWDGPALGWCTEDSMSKNAQQWTECIVNATKGEYDTKVN